MTTETGEKIIGAIEGAIEGATQTAPEQTATEQEQNIIADDKADQTKKYLFIAGIVVIVALVIFIIIKKSKK